MTYQLKAIGKVKNDENGTFIQLESEYIPGLQALEGFSHINVLWWFSDCDNDADRNELQTEQPYKGAPEVMGVFATRSPARPNPISLTASEIINIDFTNGMIRVTFTDASPLRKEDVADLKEWLGNSSIYQFWGKRPGKSDLNPELLFQKPEKSTKSFHWGVIHKQDNKVIGDMWVYLIENDRMAKMAFRLSPAYQGNRLMTEALARVTIFCFEKTELQRLWADVHTQNMASYKTLEKAGFKHEGLVREDKMLSTYCDYYLYGMTKADYIEITDKGLPPYENCERFFRKN